MQIICLIRKANVSLFSIRNYMCISSAHVSLLMFVLQSFTKCTVWISGRLLAPSLIKAYHKA